MLDFISQRKKAGILAAAMGLSALVSGCSSSKGENSDPNYFPPAIESPVESEEPNNEIIIGENKYLVEIDEYKEGASNDVMNYYNKEARKGFFWLDTDLLTKEVAYARALVDAYNNGMCPKSIEKEVAILAELSKYDFDPSTVDYESFIGDLNSLYNRVAFMDETEFESFRNYTLSALNIILPYRIKELDEETLEYYYVAKILHEACCEENHSKKNSEGYNYCPLLDEANEVLQSDVSEAFVLRLK